MDEHYRGVGVAEMEVVDNVQRVKSVYATGGMQVRFDEAGKNLWCSSLDYKFTVCTLPKDVVVGSLTWNEKTSANVGRR